MRLQPLSVNIMKWTEEEWLLAALFPVCSLSGLAAVLRTGKSPTKLEMASALLNSGLFGVAVAAIMLDHLQWESWRLIFGISILAGLGGNSLLVFCLSIAQRVLQSLIERKQP